MSWDNKLLSTRPQTEHRVLTSLVLKRFNSSTCARLDNHEGCFVIADLYTREPGSWSFFFVTNSKQEKFISLTRIGWRRWCSNCNFEETFICFYSPWGTFVSDCVTSPFSARPRRPPRYIKINRNVLARNIG